jgi:DNA-binding NarL/FixJ family response regulator
MTKPCGVFILYQNELFAEGLRSLLEQQKTIAVLGMTKSTKNGFRTACTFRPDVLIVEESRGAVRSPALQAALRQGGIANIVTLSLDHKVATVYHYGRSTIDEFSPAGLVQVLSSLGATPARRARRGPGESRRSQESGAQPTPSGRSSDRKKPGWAAVHCGKAESVHLK